MRQWTHRILDQYSLPHNSWNHSGPHPWSCSQSDQALPWTLKNSLPISRLTKILTMRRSNTSTTHQTWDGHNQPMASSDIVIKFTSRKLETCGSEYYNTSMTTFSLNISVKTKPWHQSDANTHGPDFRTLSLSFVCPVQPVCILNHSTTSPMACSNNFQYLNNLDFNIHGLDSTATKVI